MTTRPTLRRTRATLTALVAVVALGLSACGGDDDASVAEDPTSEASPTPTESDTEPAEPTEGEDADPTEPVCSEVWVAGQPLPEKYRGCYDSEKEKWVEAMVYRCSAGEKVVTWRRNFYAVGSEAVVESSRPLARDPEFRRLMKTCGA